MVDFKYYLSADHFKIGHFGDKHVKRINLALVISGIVIVLTVIFYIIMYAFTNFNALDDLQEYTSQFTEADNKELDDIVMAAKIMPSYNFKKNAIFMTKTRDVDDTIIPGAIGISEALELNNTFMLINKTDNFFPKFKYTMDNIPVGSSITMCVSLHWATKDKGENYDLAQPVLNFPICAEAQTGKFIWNDEDPINGIDVPVWTQTEYDIDCTDDEDCESACDGYNALYLNGKKGKKCYSYKILKSICITVSYNSLLQTYDYVGGCFADGVHYLMTDPEKNQIYHFESVLFEVRNVKDPILKAGQLSNYTYSFGASMDGFAIFLNILFFLAFFTFLGTVGFIFYYKHKLSSGAGSNNLMNKNEEKAEAHEEVDP